MTSPNRPVLVVDDDEVLLRLLSVAIERMSPFRVVTRLTGFGLSAVLVAERPSVVVLDVSMPGLDGPKVWGVARAALDPPPGVLFYSGILPEDLQALASRFPEARALAKPAPLDELVRMVVDLDRQTRIRESARRPSRP